MTQDTRERIEIEIQPDVNEAFRHLRESRPALSDPAQIVLEIEEPLSTAERTRRMVKPGIETIVNRPPRREHDGHNNFPSFNRRRRLVLGAGVLAGLTIVAWRRSRNSQG